MTLLIAYIGSITDIIANSSANDTDRTENNKQSKVKTIT